MHNPTTFESRVNTLASNLHKSFQRGGFTLRRLKATAEKLDIDLAMDRVDRESVVETRARLIATRRVIAELVA